jgi:hypothetical protein
MLSNRTQGFLLISLAFSYFINASFSSFVWLFFDCLYLISLIYRIFSSFRYTVIYYLYQIRASDFEVIVSHSLSTFFKHIIGCDPHSKASVKESAAWLDGCGVARLLACRTAVRKSQVRFPTWHPHGGLTALSGTCDEETQRDFNEWRWMYVKIYECMLKMEKSIKNNNKKSGTVIT